MGLFDQVLGAINNPEQEASSSQLGGILNAVQQLGGSGGADSGAVNTAMSIVGNYTRSALKDKRDSEGENGVQSLINQFAGTSPNNDAVNALFGASQIGNMVEEIGGKTGLDTSAIQGMLPTIVPLVLNFLKTGNNSQNPLSNPLVSSFLDADGDGDVDIADAMNMAGKFLG